MVHLLGAHDPQHTAHKSRHNVGTTSGFGGCLAHQQRTYVKNQGKKSKIVRGVAEAKLALFLPTRIGIIAPMSLAATTRTVKPGLRRYRPFTRKKRARP